MVCEEDRAVDSWSLSSASGRERFLGRVKRRLLYAGQELMLVEVGLNSSFWQRDSMLEAGAVHSPLVGDSTVLLPQVIVAATRLDELRQTIERWLVHPMPFCVELAINDQSLTMTCGARPEFVSTVEKPVCTICYASGGLLVSASFIIDQSCLTSLSDDLRRIS